MHGVAATEICGDVGGEASFTRAAARNFVVQSALSHQIKALETELGVTLFARTSRRVALTAAGEAFLPGARASLEAAERAAVDATAASGLIRGQLRLGVIPTVTAIDVPAILERYRRKHPEVRIALRVAGSDELELAIAQGEVDVAVLGLPESRLPRGVAWRTLVTDRHVAIVSNQHQLATLAEVQLSDLAEESFADFPAGTPGRIQSDLAFAAAGLHRDVPFEAMAPDLLIGLVKRNLAIMLLPSRYAPVDSRLVAIPVVNGPTRSEHLAWSDFNPSPAANAFLAASELRD
jgi:DNA-binding transcriptional LysR family regulator